MRRVSLVMAGVALVVGGCSSGGRTIAAAARVTTTTEAPVTTTTTTVPTAPPGSSFVVSPVTSPLQFSATAGGPPVGTLPTVTWGGPTYRPVVAQTADWVQIQLDTRPNQSTGWVPRSAINLAIPDARIVVSISQRSLTLYDKGQATYSSPVGVGKPESPTPVGLSFVDAIVATPKFQLNVYGPIVLILGSHSEKYTEFDGGDGTVAIHGYPSDPSSTRGVASSHGCVRASPDTINAISKVPLGTPVEIVA